MSCPHHNDNTFTEVSTKHLEEVEEKARILDIVLGPTFKDNITSHESLSDIVQALKS